jgi:hypothetical protein
MTSSEAEFEDPKQTRIVKKSQPSTATPATSGAALLEETLRGEMERKG